MVTRARAHGNTETTRSGERLAEVMAAIADIFMRGSVAGFVGGVGFLIATMAFVTTKGLPAVAPLIDNLPVTRGNAGCVAIPPHESHKVLERHSALERW